MKKILKTITTVALSAFLAFSSAGCSANVGLSLDPFGVPNDDIIYDDVPDVETGDKAGFELVRGVNYDAGLVDNTDDEVNIYNSDLYYLNQVRAVGADPGAMYVSEADIVDSYRKYKAREAQKTDIYNEEQFELKYGTEQDWIDQYANRYYVVTTGSHSALSAATKAKYPEASYAAYYLRTSTDLNDWVGAGALDGYAVMGTSSSAYRNYACWAPEFKRDPVSGLYMMFFSMGTNPGNQDTEYNPYTISGAETAKWDEMYLAIAISESPVGPYNFITSQEYYEKLAKYNADGTIYTEEVDGKKVAVYRDDLKTKGGESLAGQFLTYVESNGRNFVNANGNKVTNQTPALNFAYFCQELREHPAYKHINPGYEDRAIFPCIDINPLVNAKGEMFIYFSQHISSINEGNHLWVIQMRDWATPMWDTLTHVTTPSASCVYNTDDLDINGYVSPTAVDEGGINEGCFVIERDGWYYMTYSPFGYGSRNYSIYLAISNNPFGPFVKLPEYSPVIGVDKVDGGDYMAGTGHHCFIEAGDEIFALYHAFYNPVNNNDDNGNFLGRAIGVDKISFNTHDQLTFESVKQYQIDKELLTNTNHISPKYTNDELVALINEAFDTCNDQNYNVEVTDTEIIPMMYGNGPTYSLQPLPYVSLPNGYTNVAIADDAHFEMVSGYQETLKYANDEMFTYQQWSKAFEVAGKSELKVKVSWDTPKAITNVMIYNSRDILMSMRKVRSVVFKLAEKPAWYPQDKEYNGYCYIYDLPIDPYSYDYNNQRVRKGGSAMATFAEMKVTEVIVTLNYEDKDPDMLVGDEDVYKMVKFSELLILGKDA